MDNVIQRAPQVDWLSDYATKCCMLGRRLIRRHRAFWTIQYLLALRRLEKRGRKEGERHVCEVPRFTKKTLNPEKFRQLLSTSTPIVLEGFANSSPAVREWSPEFFARNYGNVEVQVTDDTGALFSMRLGDYLNAIFSNSAGTKYVHNTGDIFHCHPELEHYLPIEELASYSKGIGKHVASHLFLGALGSGSTWHCGGDHFNLFVMISGEKEWLFVNPQHTAWMYPLLQFDGLYGISPIVPFTKSDIELPICSSSDSDPNSRFPLYKYVPKLHARLCPGDVVLSPSWWWHAVANISPITLGVATRWFSSLSFNPWFDKLSRLGKWQRARYEMMANTGKMSDEVNVKHFDLREFTELTKGE